jgi:hypothetical protein
MEKLVSEKSLKNKFHTDWFRRSEGNTQTHRQHRDHIRVFLFLFFFSKYGKLAKNKYRHAVE